MGNKPWRGQERFIDSAAGPFCRAETKPLSRNTEKNSAASHDKFWNIFPVPPVLSQPPHLANLFLSFSRTIRDPHRCVLVRSTVSIPRPVRNVMRGLMRNGRDNRTNIRFFSSIRFDWEGDGICLLSKQNYFRIWACKAGTVAIESFLRFLSRFPSCSSGWLVRRTRPAALP